MNSLFTIPVVTSLHDVSSWWNLGLVVTNWSYKKNEPKPSWHFVFSINFTNSWETLRRKPFKWTQLTCQWGSIQYRYRITKLMIKKHRQILMISYLHLSSNRSWVRTNQNVRIIRHIYISLWFTWFEPPWLELGSLGFLQRCQTFHKHGPEAPEAALLPSKMEGR